MLESWGDATDAPEYARPSCLVDALDSGQSLANKTAVEASSWSLAIFNAPNHGTYGMKAQGPVWHEKPRHIEFGAVSFIAMADALPNATIMSLNVGENDVPRLNQIRTHNFGSRLLHGTAATADPYKPMHSERVGLSCRTTNMALQRVLLLMPQHTSFVFSCRNAAGELDALKFVLASLHSNPSGQVVLFGSNIMNFEVALAKAEDQAAPADSESGQAAMWPDRRAG